MVKKVEELMDEMAMYKLSLIKNERSDNTVGKYMRDLRNFLGYAVSVSNVNSKINSCENMTGGIGGECGSGKLGNVGIGGVELECGSGNCLDVEVEIGKLLILGWKESLCQRYAKNSVNSMLVAVNGFMDWLGLGHCKVVLLKLKRNILPKPEKALTQREYERLLATAKKKKNTKLFLIIQSICLTGIKVSELKYITFECLKTERLILNSKRKNRTVLLPLDLCKRLKAYCREEKIVGGVIFMNTSGRELSRTGICQMMKSLSKKAKVSKEKVFPHNLRNLFARKYYQIEKNITSLADVLGHANINTTRIYTIEKEVEQIK